MGYFNGDIGLTATEDPDGGVDVGFSVVEFPIIKKIVFTANTPTGEPSIPSAELKAQMNTKEGQVINTVVFQRDLDHLFNRDTSYTRDRGFIMDPSPDLNLDPLTGVLTIPLIEAHIDHILIKGNKKTKVIVITREMRSKPGDVLNENDLQKDMTKIYNLGLFDQVGPFALTPTDIGKVDVTVPLTEKRSGQVSVGVGYSSRSQLVGQAQLAENNFRGLGERVAIMWEVDAVSTAQSVDLTYFEPYLDRHHTSLNVDLYDKALYRFTSDAFGGGITPVGTDTTYIEQHKGVTLGVNHPVSDVMTAGLTLRAENVQVNNVQLPPQDLFIRQVGDVIGVGINATINTRDNDFSPAEGAFRQARVEMCTSNTTTVNNTPGPLVPGEHDFPKFTLDLRQYISLQGPRKKFGDIKEPKKVFAIHFEYQATDKNVPFFEQEFIGGADSLRSLLTDRYWGNQEVLGQAELRIPIGKENVQGVIFSDVGDAWGSIYQDSQFEQHSNFTLSSDVGLGIRLVLPIGPIRIDYAVGSGGGQTQFSIGQSF
jgi:outer membrane protein insertion porin family